MKRTPKWHATRRGFRERGLGSPDLAKITAFARGMPRPGTF